VPVDEKNMPAFKLVVESQLEQLKAFINQLDATATSAEVLE
jgi:hypothetical protein